MDSCETLIIDLICNRNLDHHDVAVFNSYIGNDVRNNTTESLLQLHVEQRNQLAGVPPVTFDLFSGKGCFADADLQGGNRDFLCLGKYSFHLKVQHRFTAKLRFYSFENRRVCRGQIHQVVCMPPGLFQSLVLQHSVVPVAEPAQVVRYQGDPASQFLG